MLIKDLHIFESFSDISVEDLGIADIVKQADQNLSDPASRAITDFVGGPHYAKDAGQLFGAMWSKPLEDAFSDNPSQEGMQIKQQLVSAFEPVKHYLEQKFGQTITLYRAQMPVKDKGVRHTLSWTSNPLVAASFAGIDQWEMKLKPISDETIAKALQIYHNTGQVNFRGKTYKRTDSPTDKNHDPNVDDYYYDIWKGNEFITDGYNLKAEFQDQQQYIQSLIDKREDKQKNIITAVIPVEDIIWITNRFGQSEFILKNKLGRTGYISNQA